MSRYNTFTIWEIIFIGWILSWHNILFVKTKPALHRSNVDIGIQNQDLNSQDKVLVFTGLKKASIFLIQNPSQEKA